MFFAIKLGFPDGGSSNKYFIGAIDGFEFKQNDSITKFMESGQDFYPFQTFSDSERDVMGSSWECNLQSYTN